MQPADWVLRPTAQDAPEGDIEALTRGLDVPPLVARLLWERGQRTPARARRFLSPKLADLAPPEGLTGMDKAAERLARALNAGERIAICGDYDVDGMTGTALLVRFVRVMGGDVCWSIPDRGEDGYGLSPRMVEGLAAEGAQVAVTVDNGVTAHAALERARALGIDVLVTDHHLPGDELPPAYAIVNPHLDGAGDAPPCGCALGFKLAWATADKMRARLGKERMAAFRTFLRDGVALAAMASIADVVPLQGENRVLVAAGLGALRRSPHPGLQALLEVAQVGKLPITTEDVGFRIGPRLNAAGRLSKPGLVIDLLTCDEIEEARALAKTLDGLNQERKAIEQEVLTDALAQARELMEAGPRHSLVVAGEGWHAGVIGIVAARLVDRYGVPSVVIGLEDGSGRGSGRSPDGLDLHAAFTASEAHLGRYGGHAQAAGLEIETGAVEGFRAAFEEAIRTQTGGEALRPRVAIDMRSAVDDWHLESVHALRRLAPFGKDNPEPVFLVPGAEVAGKPRLMGAQNAHLSFALKQDGGAIRVVGFRSAHHYDLAASGQAIDLVVKPVINEWRGTRTPEFRLVDMRVADGNAAGS